MNINKMNIGTLSKRISKKEAANSCLTFPMIGHIYLNYKQFKAAKTIEDFMLRFVSTDERRTQLDSIMQSKDMLFSTDGTQAFILHKEDKANAGKYGKWVDGKIINQLNPNMLQVIPDITNWDKCKYSFIEFSINTEIANENIVLHFPDDYDETRVAVNGEKLMSFLQNDMLYIDYVYYKDEFNPIVIKGNYRDIKYTYLLMPVRLP